MYLTSKKANSGNVQLLETYYFVSWLHKINYCPFLSSVNIDANEGFIKSGQSPVLTVMSAGHALHVFINGQLSGSDIFSI